MQVKSAVRGTLTLIPDVVVVLTVEKAHCTCVRVIVTQCLFLMNELGLGIC